MADNRQVNGGEVVDPADVMQPTGASAVAPAAAPGDSTVVDASDVVAPAAPVPTEQAAGPTAAGMQAAQMTTRMLGEHVHPDDVAEPEKPERPGIPAELTTPAEGARQDRVSRDELQRIADYYHVDPKMLREAAPVFRSVVDDPDAPATDKEKWDAVLNRRIDTWTAGLAAPLYKKIKAGLGDDQKTNETWDALTALEQLQQNKRSTTEKVLVGGQHLAGQIGASGVLGGALGLGVAAAGVGGVSAAGEAVGAAKTIGGLLGEAITFGGAGATEAAPGEGTHDALVQLAWLGGIHSVGFALGAVKTAAARKAIEGMVGSETVTGAVDAARSARTANEVAETALAEGVAGEVRSADELVTQLGDERVSAIAKMAREMSGELEPAAEKAGAEATAEVGVEAEQAATAPGSPQTAAAAQELGIQPPAAMTDAERAFEYVDEQRSLLSKSVRAGSSDPAALQAAIERQGPGFVDAAFQSLRTAQYTLRAIREAGMDLTTKAGREAGQIGFIRRIGMYFADSRFVYEAIDNRYGTEMVPLLDRMSRAYNGYTLAMEEALTHAKPVLGATRAAEEMTLDGKPFRGEVWAALNTGEFPVSRFTANQRAALRGWADHFEWMAKQAETLHTTFPELGLTPVDVMRNVAGPEASYVPHYVVDAPEYLKRMMGRMRELDLRTGPDIYHAAARGDDRARRLLHGLEIWVAGDITDPAHATDALAKLFALNRTGEALNTSARSLFARTGYIPEFLLEKDASKLASSWAQNMYRHLFLRGPLTELSHSADMLSTLSPGLSDYVASHVKDVAGIRRGTPAAWLSDKQAQWRSRMLTAADEAATPLAKNWYGLMSNVDTMAQWCMGNMYAGYLGLRPDSALRYMAQPFFMATPHLGAHPDSLRRISTAYAQAMADMSAPGALRDMITREGHLPAEQAFEMTGHLSSGLKEGGFLAKTKAANDAVNHFSMGMFRAGDLVGRAVTRRIADGVIDDLAAHLSSLEAGDEIPKWLAARGESAAMAVREASPGYRMVIQREMRAGNIDAAKEAMRSHMTSHTQFDYNRIAMSEFGRSMGSMFAMFSKWPTSMLGEALGTVDSWAIGKPLPGSQARVLTKYVAPFAAAYWLNEALWDPFMKEKSPESYAAGNIFSKDLTQWTPGDTINGILQGHVAKKPIFMDAITGTVGGIATLDPSAALGAAADLAVSGAPFGVLLKRLLLEWGPELSGQGPVNIRKEVEAGAREEIVNPIHWALGLDTVKPPHPGQK